MGIVRRYRPVALTLAILLALATFLAFFFVFVLVPVLAIGLFYIVYVIAEELRDGRRQHTREAEARHSLLARRR